MELPEMIIKLFGNSLQNTDNIDFQVWWHQVTKTIYW